MIPQTKNRLFVFVSLSVVLFILFEVVGGNMIHIDGMKLMANGLCFKYLGCNSGFFGYDAVTHFTGGFLEAALVIWFFQKNSRIHFLTLVGILIVLGFGWETIEFIFDQVRLHIFHMQLLIPNQLAQPTLADTVGDIIFGIGGGIVSGLLSKLFGSRLY